MVRRQLDGGGLLQLASLLSVHLAVVAAVALSVGPAPALAVLLVPLTAAGVTFERAFRRGAPPEAVRSATVAATAACWALGVTQVALAVL